MRRDRLTGEPMPAIKIEAPKVEKTPNDTLSDSVETHPSYGQISAGRVQGEAYLYGSDFAHQNFVKIEVQRSELHRGLSRDWHFARESLVEVWLSEAQWASFVSTLNMGGGTPCTIRFDVARGNVAMLPRRAPPSDKFKSEAADRYRAAVTDLNAVIAKLKEKGRATKDDVRELEGVGRQLMDGLPWVARQFAEHIEETLEKARIEINAIAVAQVQRAGLQALGASAPVLELPRSEGEDE